MPSAQHAASGATRPKVITSNVVSVDGRLTIAPGVQLVHGDRRWDAIAGTGDPYAWARGLHDPDVLLEGSGSLVAADTPPVTYPPLTGDSDHLWEDYLPPEITGVPGRRWLAVVDGRGRVQLQFTEWPEPAWAGWHVLILTSRAVCPAHLGWLREAGIPYLVAGEGPVDLAEAFRRLRDKLGVRTIVCTGGGRLGGALLRAGLIDEIDVEVLPAAIGGRGTPALFDADPLGPSGSPARLRLISDDVTAEGHLRLRYAAGTPAG